MKENLINEEITKRIDNLEKLVYSLIKKIEIDKRYSSADTNALRQISSNQSIDLEQTKADIDYIMIMEDL